MTRTLLSTALLSVLLLTACNKTEHDDPTPEPQRVTSLDITVAGEAAQCPSGNVYLFYTEEADLAYATNEGDGTYAPVVDVSTPYSPVVRFRKEGALRELHPVSDYGTMTGGNLDNHSSVRYSQVHFDLTRLDTTYGTVRKGSVVLVVIVLNDAQSRSWLVRALQLRRDYLIHVFLPDNLKQTYVRESELSAKWWQVEGGE